MNTQNKSSETLKANFKCRNSDSIKIIESDYNIGIRCSKVVPVTIEWGKEQELSLDSILKVTIEKHSHAGNHIGYSKSLRVPMAVIMAAAVNGLFEIFSTNPKSLEQCTEQGEAWEHGFLTRDSWLASQKKEPFIMAKFIGALQDEKNPLELASAQRQQFLDAKAVFPKSSDLGAFLLKAYDSPKWAWLRVLMDEAGYSIAVIDSSSIESLL